MLVAQQTNAKDTTRGLRTQHNKRFNKHKQENNDIDIEEDVAFFTRTLQGSLPPTPSPGPVANPDFASVPAGGSVFVPVLDNDTPAPGETLTLQSILPPDQGRGPENGNCAVSGNFVEYSPIAGFTGTDSCVYFACAQSSCVTATVTFEVVPTPSPTPEPSIPVTTGNTDTVGTNNTLAPTPGVVRPNSNAPPPITPFPTEPNVVSIYSSELLTQYGRRYHEHSVS